MTRIRSTSTSAAQGEEPEAAAASHTGAAPSPAARSSAKKQALADGTVVERQSEAEARAAQAEHTRNAVGLATEALTRSWDNLLIDEKDAGRALQVLGRLSGSELKSALEALDGNGTLEKLGEAMSPEQRAAFLELARKKGLVELSPAAEAPKGPGQPPAPASLYDNDPRLPPALRDLIHSENLDRAYGYFAEYRGYQDRYTAAVEKAKSPLELRALGAAVPPSVPSESLTHGDPAYDRYLEDWMRVTNHAPTISSTARAITHRIEDLKGEDRAGSLALYANVKPNLKRSAGSSSVEISGEAEVKLRDYGKFTHKESLKATLSSPVGKASVQVKEEKGATKVKGNANLAAGPVHFRGSFSGGEGKPLNTAVNATLGLPGTPAGIGAAADEGSAGPTAVQFHAGPFVEVEDTNEDGKRVARKKVGIPSVAKFEHKATLGKRGQVEKSEWEVELGPVGFKADSEGKVEAKVSLGGVAGIGTLDTKQHTFGGAAELGGESLKVRIGAELQGASPEDAALMFGDNSIHSPWPALENGVEWSKLSAEDRQRAAWLGITAHDWANAIKGR